MLHLYSASYFLLFFLLFALPQLIDSANFHLMINTYKRMTMIFNMHGKDDKDGDDGLNTFEMMGPVTRLLNYLFEFDALLPTQYVPLHCPSALGQTIFNFLNLVKFQLLQHLVNG